MSIFAEIQEKFSSLTMDTFAENNEKRENYLKEKQSRIVEMISNILESYLPVLPYNTTSVVFEITEISYCDNSLIASTKLNYSDSVSAPIYRQTTLFTFNGKLGNDDKGAVDNISATNFEKGYIYISDNPEFGKIHLNELFDDGFSISIPITTKWTKKDQDFPGLPFII